MALAGGGVFLLQFVLETYLLIPAGIAIGLGALGLAFVRVNHMPLTGFIAAYLQYMLFPRLYVWKKKGVTREQEVYAKKKPKKEQDDTLQGPSRQAVEDRLRAYASRQDTRNT